VKGNTEPWAGARGSAAAGRRGPRPCELAAWRATPGPGGRSIDANSWGLRLPSASRAADPIPRRPAAKLVCPGAASGGLRAPDRDAPEGPNPSASGSYHSTVVGFLFRDAAFTMVGETHGVYLSYNYKHRVPTGTACCTEPRLQLQTRSFCRSPFGDALQGPTLHFLLAF